MRDPVPLLQAVQLHKTYRKDANKVEVLKGLSLEVSAGDFVSVLGASGSGKSTMLHLLGTLDRPDSGTIHLEGTRIDHLPGPECDRLRNQTFGFIFQFYHLLPELTALENVLLPQMIARSVRSWWRGRREMKKAGLALLEQVGLGQRWNHRPRELSGGEMQRAAIARALFNRPPLLLADEPTGNLDAETGAQIVQLLRDLNRQAGLTIIMVTHNLDIVADTDRVVRLVHGRIESVEPPESKVVSTVTVGF